MGKHTNTGNDLSGIEYYQYKNFKIQLGKYYIYEVNLYKFWKNGYCFLGSKRFYSRKLLNIKKERIYRYFKNYIIEKEICFIAAPYEFIKDLQKI